MESLVKQAIRKLEWPSEGLSIKQIATRLDLDRFIAKTEVIELAREGFIETTWPRSTTGPIVDEILWTLTGWSMEIGAWYRERRDSRVDHIIRINNLEDIQRCWSLMHMPDGNCYSYERAYVFSRPELTSFYQSAYLLGLAVLQDLGIMDLADISATAIPNLGDSDEPSRSFPPSASFD